MSETNTTAPAPTAEVQPPFQAFQMQPLDQPFQKLAFGVMCSCGQTVFSLAGYNLALNVPDGMDVKAICRCGKEHSLQAQSEANKAAMAAMEAQKKAQEAQASTATPAAPPEAPQA